MRKESLVLVVLAGVILFSLYGITNAAIPAEENVNDITGYQAFEAAPSRVEVFAAIAIAGSDNLTDPDGIIFEDVLELPAENVNATGNYNPLGTDSNYSNQTEYNITVSENSNVNVDFCIFADRNLTATGGEFIPIDYYFWSNISRSTNITQPYMFIPGKPLAVNHTDGGFFELDDTKNLAPGETNHYRFWLNVSAGQAPGEYTNKVYFKAYQTGTSCPEHT